MKRLPAFPSKFKAFIKSTYKGLSILYVVLLYIFAVIAITAGVFISSITSTILGIFLVLIPLVYIIATRRKSIEFYDAFDLTIVLSLIPIAIATSFLIFIEQPISKANMNGDRWIAVFSAMITFSGTCFLGVVAFIQNKNAHATNQHMLDVDKMRNLHTIMTPTFLGFVPYPSPSEHATLELATPNQKGTLCARTFSFQMNFKTSNEYAIKYATINSMRITLDTGETFCGIAHSVHIYELDGQTVLPNDDHTIRNVSFSPDLEKVINHCIITTSARFQYRSFEPLAADSNSEPINYDNVFPTYYDRFKVEIDLTATNIFYVSVNAHYHFHVEKDNSSPTSGAYKYKVVVDNDNIYNMSINNIFTEDMSKLQTSKK